MKKAITVASSLLVVAGALAQGTINFNNRVPTASPPIDAPVFYSTGVCTVGRLEGADFLVQLYAGTQADNLAPIGAAIPFKTGADAGYFGDPTPRQVDTVVPGGFAFVKVVAWKASSGATYKEAVTRGFDTGESFVLKVKTGGGTPTLSPADLVGLMPFTVFSGCLSCACPEPGVPKLAVLGGLVLLLFPRNRAS